MVLKVHPWNSSVGVTWALVRNADLPNQKLREWGPAICVSASPPGGSHAGPSSGTTGAKEGCETGSLGFPINKRKGWTRSQDTGGWSQAGHTVNWAR